MKYKRVLLKLSGEALGGEQGFGINNEKLDYFTREIVEAINSGIQLGLVIGGGNIFRGADLIEKGFVNRVKGDYMGMLSTVINGLALQTSLEKLGVGVKLITSFKIEKIGEMYNQDKVMQYLDESRVVIFAGGTSNPFFTTDTTAALRAVEIQADALLKGTKVDGVYSADPMKDQNAIKYDQVSFDEVISKNLRVMDQTAFTLCKENQMPIVVFNSLRKGELLRLLQNGGVGSVVQ